MSRRCGKDIFSGFDITKESEDLFVVKVKGTLAFEDLKDFERRPRAAIDRSKRVKMLAVFEEFAGWGKEGDWGDLTFMYEYDPFIGGIAVVAENRWKAVRRSSHKT